MLALAVTVTVTAPAAAETGIGPNVTPGPTERHWTTGRSRAAAAHWGTGGLVRPGALRRAEFPYLCCGAVPW